MYDVEQLLRKAPIEHCERHDVLASTNDRARELVGEMNPPIDRGKCTLILAEEQTAGRGRGGNRWWTGQGSIAGSLLFDPTTFNIRQEHHYLLSLAMALAIVETAAPLVAPQQAGIHWPNDVYVEDRKLAGILVEVLPCGWYIVGFGVNANNHAFDAPSDVSRKVGTLKDLIGTDIDRTEFLIELLGAWRKTTEGLAIDATSIGRLAHATCLQIGRRLTIKTGEERATGICLGIAPDGSLQLETTAGRRHFYSGVLE